MTYADEYNAKVQAGAVRDAGRMQADATVRAAEIIAKRDYGAGYRDGFAAGRASVLGEDTNVSHSGLSPNVVFDGHGEDTK